MKSWILTKLNLPLPEVVDGNSVVDDHVDLRQSESCCNCSVGENILSHVSGDDINIYIGNVSGRRQTHVSIG